MALMTSGDNEEIDSSNGMAYSSNVTLLTKPVAGKQIFQVPDFTFGCLKPLQPF